MENPPRLFRCPWGDHIREIQELQMRDGLPACADHYDSLTRLEAELKLAQDQAAGAVNTIEARPFPEQALTNDFADGSGVTAFSTGVVTIANPPTGPPITLVNDLNGPGPSFSWPLYIIGVFSASPSITIGGSGVSQPVAPSLSSTQIILYLYASGAPAGYQPLTIDGATFRNVIKTVGN